MPTPVVSLTALQIVTPQLVAPTLSVDSSVLPFVIDADLNTTRIEISIYNSVYPVTTFTTANGQNVFTTSIPLTPSVQETAVQIVGRNYNPTNGWAPSVNLPLGYNFVDPNGNVEVVVFAGETGVTQPTWPTNTPVIGTQVAVSSSILTVTATNTFQIGQLVYLTGFVGANFLNGTTVVVQTASSSQFTAAIIFTGTYTQAADSGSCQAATADNGIIWANIGPLAVTPIITFSLIFFQSNLAVQIGPPSGISAMQNTTTCQLQWATPSFAGFIGVRVMLSTDIAGINPPYVQFGDLVSDISSSVNTVIDTETSTQVNGNQTVITTTQTTMPTNYSTVQVPQSYINAGEFYALFSTVIQDSSSNAVYESQQNGPLTCGFVNLKVVNPTDFPVLQRKEDIAGRIISQILRQQPTLDLTPMSEIRSVVVDPVALELSQMSVREWFSRVSTSISAISQVDNVSGNGISDDFNSSPYKQQIARAYGLNPTDTQNLIDTQFNILGEQAGVTRGGPTTSTVILTFYTYVQPTQNITIPENATVATIADQNTPALNFITRGSAILDVQNVNSFYNSVQGWWAVTVPAECTTAGSIGNVGAGTIRATVNGLPAGINVTNLTAAAYGQDEQSNSEFAAVIQARNVTGVDTGTRHGYQVTALETPGVIATQIVAAGDVDMLRDWDPIRQKHVYGCVDIYVRGTTLSQENDNVPFTYGVTGTWGTPSTYVPVTLTNSNVISFSIPSFTSLIYPIYTGIELAVTRTNSVFYLGMERAQFDNVGGNVLVNPNDMAYQYVGSSITEAKIPLQINGQPATNGAAIAAVVGATAGTYTFGLLARLQSPLTDTPTNQPVISISSVTGQATETGAVDSTLYELIYTSDFLLNGGSNMAGDLVSVSTTTSIPTSVTIPITSANPIQIATAMNVPISATGAPQNVLSVRSADLSILYTFGVDYNIVALENYQTYAIQVLTSSVGITNVQESVSNVVTITANNVLSPGSVVTLTGLTGATWLNAATVTVGTATATQFTFNDPTLHGTYPSTPDTGLATGSAIAYQNNESVVVAFNQYVIYERPSLVTGEQQILSGVVPSPLDNAFSFVHNIWLPESYSLGVPVYPPDLYHTLTLDGWDGQYNATDGGLDVLGSAALYPNGLVGNLVPYAQRYIKVTLNTTGKVMKEGLDFTLTQDPTTGAWELTRLLNGSIPDGGTVTVSYWITEQFTISTMYPSYVQVLANEIAVTKHAAADVLIKAMVANPVDITMTVTLQANASPTTVDDLVRTAISIVLDNAAGTLYQSELISQVQAVTGVVSVEIPLLKCAKSNGSYDIGVIIPTGTTWIPLNQDPAFVNIQTPVNSFITVDQVLPDSTIPSGGEPNAIVDLLYQGQVFRRGLSVQDFLQNSVPAAHLASTAVPGSFYIFGLNDQINPTTPLTSYQQRVAIVVPQDVANPGLLSYFVTYQVFNEGGAKDITVSSTEYLTTGNIVINYIVQAS